jgi:DNA-binding transcriptional regulator GbsR (MarR family)
MSFIPKLYTSDDVDNFFKCSTLNELNLFKIKVIHFYIETQRETITNFCRERKIDTIDLTKNLIKYIKNDLNKHLKKKKKEAKETKELIKWPED